MKAVSLGGKGRQNRSRPAGN